ncbi:MAG: thermonuclease family protein [Pseudomonadota bacterium]
MAKRWLLQKGAPRKGAPFAFLWALLLFAAAPLWACPLDRSDETVVVAYVNDGDTVRLEDGRRVRFAGIDTPEIDHDGGPSEPFARAARKRLSALIDGGRLKLRYAAKKRDRYGRMLAHPYLPDGRSLSRLLLEEGLAAAVVIPPSLWHSDCYLEAEARARAAERGIWSTPQGPLRLSDRLERGDGGFTLLQGRVESIGESRKSLWLDLEGRAALRLPKEDLHYFGDFSPHQLIGQRVEARGWLTYYNDKWRMSVRHPNALKRLTR